MSLYRGAGGASDATDDSTVNAVAGYASSAASSASAASTSATNASTSASAAATSASQAASSVSTAASHASNASTSASNASTSASSASSSASSASASATNASNSAGSASTYASEALGYRNTASTHATNAANSASAAAGSATSASNSAASALAIYGNTIAMEAAVDDAQEAALTATQESQAASDSAIASAESEELAYEHEQNAAEWATVAQGAANSSVAAAGAASLAWDQFDDRYLGAKTVDPALDNDNNPLVIGALYFNSATGSMKVYTGTNWTDAYTTNNGFLLANNNLSDVQSDATARDNLGLGSIATQDYDTITITGGSITGITDLAINDGGTGASTAAGARSNLGLGSSAVLNAGVPGGVATLDGGGAVPTSQLPAAVLGAVKYQGVWNASSNSPAITSSTGTQGHYYVVFTAGSTSIDGISDWKVGDWIIYNGAVWQKIDNTDLVSSVNGYTGTINLAYSDVGAPSTSGTNATGTWGIDVTGNAATVTNGVYTTGSYANPTWIASIAGSKVTGDISGNAGTVTNGVYTTGDQTIAGTKTLSSNPILSGGTANSVQYLNASKVLTSDANFVYTSTGLGIGTSSPSTKLTVHAGADGDVGFFRGGSTRQVQIGTSSTAGYINTDNGSAGLEIRTQGTARAYFDNSGNLGLGVTPSAWGGSSAKAFEIGTWSGLSDGGAYGTVLTFNGRYNSGWFYKATNSAAKYEQDGAHRWYTAPSGTAGNAISFTQAMTLDASGNLGIGTTSTSSYILRVNAASPLFGMMVSGTQAFTIGALSGGGGAFYYGAGNVEAARIDSSGNLLVGTSSGAYHVLRKDNENDWSAAVVSNATSPQGLLLRYTAASPNGTGNNFWLCYDGGGTTRASLRSNGGLANVSANDVNLSDRREKTNFAPAKSYLETICAIPVQTFNYIDQSEDDPGLTLGVVAQDVQAVAPELVMESDWGDEENPKMRLSIYQTDLQYALMKCIQELKAELDTVKSELQTLKGA